MTFNGSLAAGNTGHMQIELIHQSDGAPTVFTEVIREKGYGLHHQAIAVRDFDAQMNAYQALGYEIAFDSGAAKPNRAVHMDAKGQSPFFLEVLEATRHLENAFAGIYRASVGWDGSDPVHDLQSLTNKS